MAVTNTTTAVKSFSKTPQAGDDCYELMESDTAPVLMDVMANDLGGASKTLWSLDDGDCLTDLLIKESVESVPSTSEMGVTITIVDGQVRYDISSAPQDFRDALESLAEGEVGYDQFTYAIRLGNGTLSWATVWVKFTGTNDAPVLTIDTSGGVTEDASAPDLTDSGVLSIFDVDATDTHVVSAAYNDDATWSGGPLSAAQSEAFAAGFSVDGDGWTYTVSNAAVQFLGSGETITLSFNVTATDDSGAANNSDTETVTVTITGTNDAPVITVGADDEATASLTETNAGLTAEGTLTISDVDQLDTVDVSVTGLAVSGTGATSVTEADLLAMMTIEDDGAWSFDTGSEAFDNLADGQTLVLTYTVTADDGEDTDDHEIIITITGSNDAPVVTSDSTASVTENDTAVMTVTATDPDAGDTPAFSITGGADGDLFEIDPDTGALVFKAAPNFEAPADADTDNSYVVEVTATDDGGLTSVQTITVTVTNEQEPANITGTDSGSVTEDGTLVAGGTLSANDPDAGENSFLAANIAGAYGSLSLLANGSWSYTLDNNDADLATLDAGEQQDEEFTIYSADGTSHVITVTVHGASEGDPNDFDDLGNNNSSSTQGAGHDTVYGTDGVDTINTGSGNDTIYTGAGSDNVTAGPNSGSGTDSDLVYAGSGDDTVIGGRNRDILYGGSGGDVIDAGAGNDTITGGYGADTLTGGDGDDEFVFLSTLDAGDTITDFKESGADTIHLEGSAFGLADGTLNASAFYVGAAAHDADDRIIYDPVTGKLYYDANGNADGGVTQLAQLDTGLTLTNGDFIVF